MTKPAANQETAPHLHKTLRWYDGIALALGVPTGLFATVGYTTGALGAWAAIAIFGAAALIAVLQNLLFAEMASMFPDKPGGIALFGHEGWKRYVPSAGAVATFGYWMGWSLTLGFIGLTIGNIAQAQWFASSTGHFTLLGNQVGLPQWIAVGTIVLAWLLNVLGIKVAAGVNRVLAAVFAAVLVILGVGGFLHGHWHAANLSWHVADWKTAIVWLYIAGWVAYGSELCATFGPEFRDGAKDTSRALKASAVLSFASFVVVPMGVSGAIGEKAIANNPVGYASVAADQILGGGGNAVTVVILAAFFLMMVSSSADASRALYGLAVDDMTIKQLGVLNRFGVPSRALGVDCLVNIAIVLLVSSPLGVLLASNLGYILSIVIALIGYILLRRDRPTHLREISVGPAGTPLAVLLTVVNAVMLVVGVTNPHLAGYGGAKETLIGVGLLSCSLLLLGYRRLVQDASERRTATGVDVGELAAEDVFVAREHQTPHHLG